MDVQEEQAAILQHPSADDRNEWKQYWESQGMPWRTEPEITEERQRQLNKCRVFPSEIPGFDANATATAKVDYDFTKDPMPSYQGIEPRLGRADIEWLIASQDFGRGPINWHEPSRIPYPWRRGLDLRGSDLRGVDLSGLPLSCIRAGCMEDDMVHSTPEECEHQAAHLEHANLRDANLQCALLGWTHLDGANLKDAHLEFAYLGHARLQGADLDSAYGLEADFTAAQLQDAYGANACLQGASFWDAHAERAEFWAAEFHGAWFQGAHLEGADVHQADFGGESLPSGILEAMRQWDEDVSPIIPPAHLNGVFFDGATNLRDISLGNEEYGYAKLADVHWNDVNLAVVDWTCIRRGLMHIGKRIDAFELGDEREANQATYSDGDPKDKARRLKEYRDAVRAYRQLATALRDQGLNEDADRFAYMAQNLQRQVLWRQHRYGAAFGSWLLNIVAGYGYKPMRTLAVYLLALVSFAIAYFILGQTVGPHLSPLGAFVFSMTSFHGRGFFPGGIVLDDPITVLAALEAFVGLVVEVSFIATFTQRFFAR